MEFLIKLKECERASHSGKWKIPAFSTTTHNRSQLLSSVLEKTLKKPPFDIWLHVCACVLVLLGKKNWKVHSLFETRMQLHAWSSEFFSNSFLLSGLKCTNNSLNTMAFIAFSLWIPFILVSLCLFWDMCISCLSYICYPDEQCHEMHDSPNGLKFWHHTIGYNRWGCIHSKPKNVCLNNKMFGARLPVLGLHIVHILTPIKLQRREDPLNKLLKLPQSLSNEWMYKQWSCFLGIRD